MQAVIDMGSRSVAAGQRHAALGVGALALGGLWALESAAGFLAAWVLLTAWVLWRSRHSSGHRTPWFGMVAMALGGLAIAWPSMPPVATSICLAIASGVVPAHLWIEDVRRSLGRSEFALLVIAQPGVALLHAYLSLHPHSLPHSHVEVLRTVMVLSALAQSGLALVRREPERSIGAVAASQGALALAGTLVEDHGWEAARMMLASLALASAVLLACLIELRRRHGVAQLSHRHALAESSPDLHRMFVACGWLFVGLPGGAMFFAEDLLFHALVHEAPLATCGFVLAVGLNAVAFYRVYLGVFAGSSRNGPAAFASAIEPPRPEPVAWLLPVLSLLTFAQFVFGFFPMLLL